MEEHATQRKFIIITLNRLIPPRISLANVEVHIAEATLVESRKEPKRFLQPLTKVSRDSRQPLEGSLSSNRESGSEATSERGLVRIKRTGARIGKLLLIFKKCSVICKKESRICNSVKNEFTASDTMLYLYVTQVISCD